jgi:hypothetical protein
MQRRNSVNQSAGSRHGHASSASKRKIHVSKHYHKESLRTRTSLVGVTIDKPDIEPSPQARKLPEALNT